MSNRTQRQQTAALTGALIRTLNVLQRNDRFGDCIA